MRNFLLFAVLFVGAVGCSSQTMPTPSELPLEKGTTWVYSYEAYEQAADPSRVIKATYQLTESVVDVESVSPYPVAHIKRDFQLVRADDDWADEFTDTQKEFWYVVNGRQVLESAQSPDDAKIYNNSLLLAYDFPLTLNKVWCLTSSKDSNEISSCETIGKRKVTDRGVFETPLKRFENCYELTDYYNTGNFIQWFCEGVGMVFLKFDHTGTKYGFEQTLIDYSIGTP